MNSPYENQPMEKWINITEEIVGEHPLDFDVIVNVVLEAWERILGTKIGGELQIGKDVFPSPQIMGNYIHELIPALLSRKYPEKWRKEIIKEDKDVVYIPNSDYSVEIKTSSNANNVFGNRSYGQENSEHNSGKSKSGYYITVNFEKFDTKNPDYKPKIKKIRFGWIDHEDWKAQKSQTGQAAPLSKEARDNKLILLYEDK
ncbi:ScaI family restriction endonuclease [Bacillus subtilis]|uniref:ScaI family restriction endonuclease n=1 Tax=Bacillus subtilis TaxID=1423 RepID=A0AAX3RN56_BACIU|nr:ScaI family restriction endonuclease [Bacillus subtilis]WGD62731.1 ScaI family restriction endonuclease [Bacillus subtilis]